MSCETDAKLFDSFHIHKFLMENKLPLTNLNTAGTDVVAIVEGVCDET